VCASFSFLSRILLLSNQAGDDISDEIAQHEANLKSARVKKNVEK